MQTSEFVPATEPSFNKIYVEVFGVHVMSNGQFDNGVFGSQDEAVKYLRSTLIEQNPWLHGDYGLTVSDPNVLDTFKRDSRSFGAVIQTPRYHIEKAF
jgi:hypothetical protein